MSTDAFLDRDARNDPGLSDAAFPPSRVSPFPPYVLFRGPSSKGSNPHDCAPNTSCTLQTTSRPAAGHPGSPLESFEEQRYDISRNPDRQTRQSHRRREAHMSRYSVGRKIARDIQRRDRHRVNYRRLQNEAEERAESVEVATPY